MFSIGEFSRITGITVKALRYYHEQGLLVPSLVDPRSGYRYYEEWMIDRAQTIVYLRKLEFPLEQIAGLLNSTAAEEDILAAVESHRTAIQRRIRELRTVTKSLDQFIAAQKQVKIMSQQPFQVEERSVLPLLIAGIRMTGRYSDCGRGFARIARSFGRLIAGPAMLLHYDTEYETDADFEACMPVKQPKTIEGISVRALPAQKCVCLIHHGPYDQLGQSYARIFKYVNEKQYQATSPTREVYLKGPGMIFKGNPKKYLTEIQIPITDAPVNAWS